MLYHLEKHGSNNLVKWKLQKGYIIVTKVSGKVGLHIATEKKINQVMQKWGKNLCSQVLYFPVPKGTKYEYWWFKILNTDDSKFKFQGIIFPSNFNPVVLLSYLIIHMTEINIGYIPSMFNSSTLTCNSIHFSQIQKDIQNQMSERCGRCY